MITYNNLIVFENPDMQTAGGMSLNDIQVSCILLALNFDTPKSLTGLNANIEGMEQGTYIEIFNAGTADVTILNNSMMSEAGNRFTITDAAGAQTDFILLPKRRVKALFYKNAWYING